MNRSRFVTAMMVAGFLFLYLPIVLMIAFSFNASRLVTVWGGFSTKWYGELVRNEQVLSAAWLSFKIAAMNATGATILGTLAGLSLARFGNFRGRPLLTGLATAPLEMPEVITGLSLLLLFVAMEQLIGWPQGRGITTITPIVSTSARKKRLSISWLSRRGIGHRVIAPGVEGVAARDALHREPPATNRSVLLERLDGVVRTGRVIPARRRQQRREAPG